MLNNDPVQKIDNIGGINIAIEWPSGSERRRVSTDDPIMMRADYGYFPGTEERSDNMELDVYLGPSKESRRVFVIKQLSRESQYDEEKVMLGYDTGEEAQESYEYHIDKIPVKFGGMREISWTELMEMIAMNLKTPEISTAESRRNEGQQQYGTPKTDEERLYSHFGKDKAEQMIAKMGLEEAIKQLPPRGTRIEQTNEIVEDKEIREGIKVEAEHKDMVTWLKAYLAERGEFPPDETIYAQIAKAHLEESPEYYKELAKMEDKMNDYKPSVLKLPTGKYKLVGTIHTDYADKRYETEEEANKALAEMEAKQAQENKNILIRKTRMVYGTKDNQWHEVGPEDRDYETGIDIDEFKRIGPEAAKAKYLGTGINTAEDRQNEGARLYGSEKKNFNRDYMSEENSNLTPHELIKKLIQWDEAEHGVDSDVYDDAKKRIEKAGLSVPSSIRRK